MEHAFSKPVDYEGVWCVWGAGATVRTDRGLIVCGSIPPVPHHLDSPPTETLQMVHLDSPPTETLQMVHLDSLPTETLQMFFLFISSSVFLIVH